MKPLLIIGAGGFGLEVAAYAKDCLSAGTESYNPRGFLDDTKTKGQLHAGLPVLGDTATDIETDALYIIAIGTPAARRKLAESYKNRGARFAVLCHPSAYVADTARIEDGAILAPFAFAGPESLIGPHALLNIYASVAHESVIGAYSVLAPYAGTHACAHIGEEVFMGAQSAVTRDVHIGARSKIAAGSIVYSSAPEGSEFFGNPARARIPSARV